MGVMSELHDDLSQIHAILLGQRKVATTERDRVVKRMGQTLTTMVWDQRIRVIDDLLLEIEAAGVVWPDNIVEIHHG